MVEIMKFQYLQSQFKLFVEDEMQVLIWYEPNRHQV